MVGGPTPRGQHERGEPTGVTGQYVCRRCHRVVDVGASHDRCDGWGKLAGKGPNDEET